MKVIYPLAFLLFFQILFACNESLEFQATSATGADNIVFKSTDGGQTWQDISEGLPKPAQDDYGIDAEGFFANDNGFYLNAGNGIYHSERNAQPPFWNKETSGKTWKQVHTGGRHNRVESNGVLLATSNKGIIRSTDNGETWSSVISEGGVGIDVERIDGGFAAITYSSVSNTRRVRTSYDGGKTWQPIDAGLPADLSIASIIQVGENFFCGHPKGIYKSTDKGKTWQLIFPSIKGKVFNLSVSGNVIYAIPRNGGC